VPNPEYQHSDSLVLDVTNQAIIAHPISPQTSLVAVEWLAQLAGVIRRLYPLPQKSDDRLLRRTV
jgi:hypothetical protein